jgi:hypothetical protein
VLRGLLPALLQEARTFLEPHLDDSDVTGLYLQLHRDQEAGADNAALRQDLRTLLDKAAPGLGGGGGEETVLLGVPAGPAGQEFRKLARQLLASSDARETVTEDEIVLYREQSGLRLDDLEQFGPVGREAYRKVFTHEHLTPHSRMDITDW